MESLKVLGIISTPYSKSNFVKQKINLVMNKYRTWRRLSIINVISVHVKTLSCRFFEGGKGDLSILVKIMTGT